MNVSISLKNITELSEEDLQSLSNILLEHVYETYLSFLSHEVIESFAINSLPENLIERYSDGRESVFCYIDDVLVGTVSFKDNEIRTFHVKHSLMKQGIGGKMIDFLLKDKTGEVFVKSLVGAVGAYEKFGFTRIENLSVKSERSEALYEVVLMKKTIS